MASFGTKNTVMSLPENNSIWSLIEPHFCSLPKPHQLSNPKYDLSKGRYVESSGETVEASKRCWTSTSAQQRFKVGCEVHGPSEAEENSGRVQRKPEAWERGEKGRRN